MALVWPAIGHEVAPYFDNGRIRVDATLNGEKIRLAYDSGASSTILFGSVAERLN